MICKADQSRPRKSAIKCYDMHKREGQPIAPPRKLTFMFLSGNVYYGNTLSNGSLNYELTCVSSTSKTVTFLSPFNERLRFTRKGVHPRLGEQAAHKNYLFVNSTPIEH